MGTFHPKGLNQIGFRDGGKKLAPDAGPDPLDTATFQAIFAGPTGTPLLGERKLMAAVLDDARHVLRTRHRQPAELYAETEAWVRSDDDDWPFSFVRLCQALRLSPDYVRRGLLPASHRHRAALRAVS